MNGVCKIVLSLVLGKLPYFPFGRGFLRETRGQRLQGACGTVARLRATRRVQPLAGFYVSWSRSDRIYDELCALGYVFESPPELAHTKDSCEAMCVNCSSFLVGNWL